MVNQVEQVMTVSEVLAEKEDQVSIKGISNRWIINRSRQVAKGSDKPGSVSRIHNQLSKPGPLI